MTATCHGPTASRPAAPLANSANPDRTVLSPATPDYFRETYRHLLKAPLPAPIYNQGGVPALVGRLELTTNPYGRLGTYLPGGPVATASHAFFRPLGTNGRACVTCHQPPSGMSFSLRNVRARFRTTAGTDPIFAPVDGANCPDAVPADHTSGAPSGGAKGKGQRSLRSAYSLLLDRGLIRVAMPWPPKGGVEPEFTLELVLRPARCNASPDFGLGTGMASVYRRPQMSAQLNFKTLRASGTRPDPAPEPDVGRPRGSLEQQAVDATLAMRRRRSHPRRQVKQIGRVRERGVQRPAPAQGGRSPRCGRRAGGPVKLSRRPVNPLFSATRDAVRRVRRLGGADRRAQGDRARSAPSSNRRTSCLPASPASTTIRGQRLRRRMRHLPQCRQCRGRVVSRPAARHRCRRAACPVGGRRRRRPAGVPPICRGGCRPTRSSAGGRSRPTIPGLPC